MNLDDYKAQRALTKFPERRPTCPRCWKAVVTCFCPMIKPFTSPVPFVIVQHLDEARNPIATARMAHLSVKNSTLVMDKDFRDNQQVRRLLTDGQSQHALLYPGPEATPIEQFLADSTKASDKQPVFWILDTTWSHGAKMRRISPELAAMPMVAFTPDRSSLFQIRKQPSPHCLSTIESMYFVMERYLDFHGLTMTDHQALLDVFQYMVAQQIKFSQETRNMRHHAIRTARAEKRRQLGIC